MDKTGNTRIQEHNHGQEQENAKNKTVDKNRKTQRQEQNRRQEQEHVYSRSEPWTRTRTRKLKNRTMDKNKNIHTQEQNHGQEQEHPYIISFNLSIKTFCTPTDRGMTCPQLLITSHDIMFELHRLAVGDHPRTMVMASLQNRLQIMKREDNDKRCSLASRSLCTTTINHVTIHVADDP
jgi:hypothetical protein